MKINGKAIEVIKILFKEHTSCKSKVTYYTNVVDYIPEGFDANDSVMLPNVLVWDPLNKYSMPLYCPHCHQDEKIFNLVSAAGWYTVQPRVLWERGWFCALVGRTYKCKKHYIVSYHPGFLSQISEHKIPFILTHLTGMTKSCYDSIVKLVEHGNSFTNIQKLMEGIFIDAFERRRATHPADSIADIVKSASYVPSDEMCKQYFILQHDLNKEAYQAQMDKIPFSRLYVSTNGSFFDVNIGFRDTAGNKKWNKLFDNMFLVFNENGCVKAYGLTSGFSIEQVIKCLIALAPFNPDTELIAMSGFCCVARDSLQEAFPTAHITYGVECAKDSLKQHLGTTNEKHEIVKELNAVFQSPIGDKGSTGDENLLLTQLNAFTVKWNKETDQSATTDMLSEPFYDEAENLKSHIVNGCLSSVPHKTFLKEEEQIFKRLGKIFRSYFIGVQTACSLIAHIVYVYNCQRLGQVKHQPIWVHKPLHTANSNDVIEQEVEVEVEVEDDEDAAAVVALSNVENLVDVETADDEESVKGNPAIQAENESQTRISEHCEQTLVLANMFRKICKHVDRLPISQRHKSTKSFLSSVNEIFDNHAYLKTCRMYSSNAQRDIKIRMMGLKCIQSPIDQPSLAYSVLTSLRNQVDEKTATPEFTELLTAKGVTGDDQETALKDLQRLISKEMVGSNEALYERFLVLNRSSSKINHKDRSIMKLIKAEVQIAMVHAAANVFGVAFVILPSCDEVPFLPVIPSCTVESCSPCFLTFNCESGIFSALVKGPPLPQPVKVGKTSCSCGRKSKKTKKVASKQCYARCPCYIAGSKCSLQCGCKCCGNGKPAADPIESVVDDAQPPVKKKARRRSRKYEVDPTFIPPPSQPPSVDAAATVVEVVSELSMHHFFLDALMFTLLNDAKTKFSDPALPDLLHGVFLTIFDELQGAIAPEDSDGFLEYLTRMEVDVVRRWVKDTRIVYKWFKDLKELIVSSRFDVKQKPSVVVAEAVSDDDGGVEANVTEVVESPPTKKLVADEDVADGDRDGVKADNVKEVVVDSPPTKELVADDDAADGDKDDGVKKADNVKEVVVDSPPVTEAKGDTEKEVNALKCALENGVKDVVVRCDDVFGDKKNKK